jgi:hypothetical protein
MFKNSWNKVASNVSKKEKEKVFKSKLKAVKWHVVQKQLCHKFFVINFNHQLIATQLVCIVL